MKQHNPAPAARRPVDEGPSSHRLAVFVDAKQASGHYTFRREEALEALGISEDALKSSAQRLAKKGRIIAPRRGFFVIVPLEYRQAGAPPPSWFIDELMAFQEQPYYVGLLSAAALHGAAHHQPQEFQVLTDAPLRPIRAGRSSIRFFVKKHLGQSPIVEMKTPTGSMRVSTPEATAIDLLRYAKEVGHLGNVATVLADLAEKLDAERLLQAARLEGSLAHLQRLGYLLDRIEADYLGGPLSKWLAERSPRAVPLRPDSPVRDSLKDPRWLVLVNETVEAEA